MKLYITLFVVLIGLSSTKAQDTITNPGFERWTNFGTYDEPNAAWHTLNPLTSALGTTVAYKATANADIHSGNFAIKLITKNVLGSPKPSLVTTGTVNVVQQSVDGGCPISARPLYLNGWYKYSPVGSDTAFFNITLFKWNGTSHDIIGSGKTQITGTVANYTNFNVPITYTTNEVPDTVQLLFVSSSNAAPQVNSTLYVDDVSYDFSTGIVTNKAEAMALYPNPAHGAATLKFNVSGDESISINIYNQVGQFVKNIYTGKTGNGLNQVDFSTTGLTQGIYFVRLNASRQTFNAKLVVE